MAKQPTVLICGGSGLIGTRLQALLRSRGYRVTNLSRKQSQKPDQFYWDPSRQLLNIDALNAHHIINLAGAGVADKRWSPRRKGQIIASRVDGADILYKKLSELKSYPRTYVSASAIGYYGDRGDELLTEDSARGSGFLAETAERWEQAADRFAKPGIRTVKFRIGVVLARAGGALAKLATPIRLMAGAPLGRGAQYVSWVHIEDLCAMLVAAIEDQNWSGVFNAVAPEPVPNRVLTERIAAVLGKPLLLPNIPEFALRLVMGEMADIVLESSRVSCAKIREHGFEFTFPELDSALRDLLLDSSRPEAANDRPDRPTAGAVSETT